MKFYSKYFQFSHKIYSWSEFQAAAAGSLLVVIFLMNDSPWTWITSTAFFPKSKVFSPKSSIFCLCSYKKIHTIMIIRFVSSRSRISRLTSTFSFVNVLSNPFLKVSKNDSVVIGIPSSVVSRLCNLAQELN